VNHHSSTRVGLRQRRRFSPQQIQQLLTQFERSGLSLTEFVRQQGLCYSVFCRWRKRQREGSLRTPVLQAVSLGSLLTANWMAEVALPKGATIRFSAQASSA